MAAVETVVICAAGTGSRLGVGVPKCLISVDGRSIIDRQLDLLEEVPEIRVTVGFREELVARHVSARRPDAIFVRNPDFRDTTTLASLRQAVAHLDRPFVALDGDLLVEPASFREFLTSCEALGPPLIGVTPSSTDDAVFVTLSDGGDRGAVVEGFHRQPRNGARMERPGLPCQGAPEPVGWLCLDEALIPWLPLPASVMTTAEVDTQDDLDRLHDAVREWERG